MRKKCSQLVETTKYYVDNHYTEDVSLNQIADQLHVTLSYLSSLFQKEQGITFRSYLNNLRTEQAKYLLETTGLSILDITVECGFNDQSYFTKVFKKYVGATPSQYRSYRRRGKNV